MATHRQQFLAALAEQERQLALAFDELAGQVIGLVTLYAAGRETTPVERQQELLQRVTALIISFYLAQPALTALTVDGAGRVAPASAFMQIVWGTMREAARLAADEQAAFLRERFMAMPELLNRLSHARHSFVSNEAMGAVSEHGAEFLAGFAPPHLFPRADGKVLEERVRYAAIDHSTRAAGLLRELFAEGATLAVIAALLRRFFAPDQMLPRGGAYGTTGVARAMAIARSEPVFSYGLAQRIGALLNPFAEQAVVRRASHPAKPCPICDPMVGVYPADDYPVPGFHPHCVCRVDFVTTSDVDRARKRMIGSGTINVRGPLNPAFVDELMGQIA